MATFKKAFKPKLTYVYRINDEAHKGVLKIGEASYDGDDYFTVQPNSKSLNDAAKERIRHQTQTAGVQFELLYKESNFIYKKGNLTCFQDHEIHDILERSGIKHKYFDEKHKANEWYYTDLETVKKAIVAAKEGRKSLNATEVSTDKSPIVLRPEQRDAIDKTIKHFGKKHSSNQMLWNAKMRFGKTLSALQLIKELDFRRTLILTHRPVVDEGWFEDYQKIFYDRPEFVYSSKNNGTTLDDAEEIYNSCGTGSYIYFASIQDLRGSKEVGGLFDKNDKIFSIDWDFIIIDEAHEGTQTELGQKVLTACRKKETRVLHLSGTPFNLMEDFAEDEIFTWDYVMEQKAKADWDILHQGDPNPYACLPKLNIFTYNLGKLFKDYADEDYAFNFREFFRVNASGEFVHKDNVIQFLNLLTKEDSESNYPFSTKEFRENFRHSLWVIPGIKEAKALSAVLQEHTVFDQYKIVNVAGDGDEEIDSKDALKIVHDAMTDKPEETYTITLSCGRLTTGVSIKPWTACFMLSGSYNTAASTYMQTIFRVQTPAVIGGKVKTECFVFDFAPDRTLKVIAETAKISAKAGKTSGNDRQTLGQFLNFCPIIGFEGSKMVTYDTPKMLEQLKKVYVEHVVKSGFEAKCLYNENLRSLTKIELDDFKELKEIIGSTKSMAKTQDLVINNLGFTEEDYGQMQTDKVESQTSKKELTPEEQAKLEQDKINKKNQETAISILRGISIRMPLLIYGAELEKMPDQVGHDKLQEQDITIDNFADVIDDESWKEFMPNGVTKEKFNAFKKYYDKDIFHSAGVRIRQIAKAADNFSIEERIERIGFIFNSFRNPDKETVLTPWRVVNMHLNDCIGGFTFFDEKFEKTITEPRFVEQNEVTKKIFNSQTKILEINSKTGLYALYCAYSVYKTRAKQELGQGATHEMQKQLWNKVLAENIYVICKTKMAKAITKRTLAGFTEAKINAHCFEDLVNSLKNESDKFVEKVTSGKCWNKENTKMEFDAVVGNPPYQEMTGGQGTQATPLYHHFVQLSKKLQPDYYSLIMPSRWFSGGFGLKTFRDEMLNDNRIKKIFDYPNAHYVFPNVDIPGGVCYLLWEKKNKEVCEITNIDNQTKNSMKRKLNEYETFIRSNIAITIVKNIFEIEKPKFTLENVVSPQRPFGLPTNYQPQESGIPCYFIQKIGKKFANKSDVIDTNNLMNKWKLFVPKAPIAGQTDFTKPVGFYYDGNTRIAEPGSVCTESFIVAGAFDTQEEILSFKSYLFTKVARFLLLQTVISQDVLRYKFCFVPDLEKYNHIYTDKELCERWQISKEEWNYIDSRIHNYGK